MDIHQNLSTQMSIECLIFK